MQGKAVSLGMGTNRQLIDISPLQWRVQESSVQFALPIFPGDDVIK